MVSILVEWALLLVWYYKLYKTIFDECKVHDPVCHLESNTTYFAALCFLYAYVLIGVPIKVFITYVQFRYYQS